MNTTHAIPTTTIRGSFPMEVTLLAGLALSLVLSMVLTRSTTNTDDMAVRIAVQQFDDVYKRARAAAVRSGRTSVVRIEDGRFWVEVDRTPDGTGERTRVGGIVDLGHTGVELAATTTSVCFDSTGTARLRGSCSAAGGRMQFSRGSSVKTVVTTATGLVPA